MNILRRAVRFAGRRVMAALTDGQWRDPAVRPEWIGSRTGGAWVDVSRLDASSVVYSFGIAFEISFDREIIAKTGCRVVGFDPDPRSAEWIHSGKVWVPERLAFEPVGIYSSSGRRELNITDAEQMTGSLVHDYRRERVSADFLTLDDIMKRRGDAFVDFVKMDIEGAEYDVLGDWLARRWSLPVGQLWVEFHPLLCGRTVRDTERFVRRLDTICLRPVRREYPHNYLLVNHRVGGKHGQA